jgi:hypothetical protein
VSALDRPARRRAADLIDGLAKGRLTNDEFEDSYPGSSDQAVTTIRKWVWHFYDDLHEHRLEGRLALPTEASRGFHRCVLFLRSDLAYEWPRYPLGPASLPIGLVAQIPPFSWIARRIGRRYEAAGDFDVWPFLRRSDYERAAQ